MKCFLLALLVTICLFGNSFPSNDEGAIKKKCAEVVSFLSGSVIGGATTYVVGFFSGLLALGLTYEEINRALSGHSIANAHIPSKTCIAFYVAPIALCCLYNINKSLKNIRLLQKKDALAATGIAVEIGRVFGCSAGATVLFKVAYDGYFLQ